MLKAGDLTKRILLQRPVTNTADSGWGASAVKTTYVDHALVWADVRGLSATEQMVDGVQTEIAYRIKIRYRPDVNTTFRVVYAGNILDILSVVDPHQAHRELILECKHHVEGANG